MVGFPWAVPLDPLVARWRQPILLAVLRGRRSPRSCWRRVSTFDANPLHTKNPHTEAMRDAARPRCNSPVTNPYTIDMMEPSVAAIGAGRREAARRSRRVDSVRSIDSFVPDDQKQKLAIISDAQQILEPTLTAPPASAPVTPNQIRLAAKTALGQIEPALAKHAARQRRCAPIAARSAAAHGPRPMPSLMAVNAALTRFLPDELDQLDAFAERRAGDASPRSRET